jgi:pimeloyl-ACP methyl ester carboxylesterase
VRHVRVGRLAAIWSFGLLAVMAIAAEVHATPCTVYLPVASQFPFAYTVTQNGVVETRDGNGNLVNTHTYQGQYQTSFESPLTHAANLFEKSTKDAMKLLFTSCGGAWPQLTSPVGGQFEAPWDVTYSATVSGGILTATTHFTNEATMLPVAEPCLTSVCTYDDATADRILTYSISTGQYTLRDQFTRRFSLVDNKGLTHNHKVTTAQDVSGVWLVRSITPRLIDPIPGLVARSNPHIDCNKTNLSSLGLPERTGTTADGVSALVLVVETSGPVSVNIANSSAGHGSLTNCRSGGTNGMPPVNGEVAVLYTPPSSFGSAGIDRRDITVNITEPGSPLEVPVTFTLERPPVIFLHGFNDSAAMWSPDWLIAMSNAGYRFVRFVSYSLSATNSFMVDPSAYVTLHTRITQTLREVRATGIAAAQVDIVAHSMGGLVSRRLALDRLLYYRFDNGFAGSIHRLVTIGTPHHGSPWASILAFRPFDGSLGQQIRSLARQVLGFGVMGAIEDMVPGSAALAKVAASEVATHTVVGFAPAEGTTVTRVGILLRVLSGQSIGLAELFHPEESDLVVGTGSQAAGFTGPTVSAVTNVVHTRTLNKLGGSDVGEAESGQVKQDVISALAGPDNAYWTTTFVPAPAPSRVDLRQTLNSASATTQLQMTSPAPGLHVTPGSPLTISIGSAPGAPSNIAQMVAMIEGVGLIAMPASVPSSIMVTLPSGLPLGPMVVGVAALDNLGNSFAGTVTIRAVPSIDPTTLVMSPVALELGMLTPIDQLTVMATLGSGTTATTVDVTRLATFVSDDPSIATVGAATGTVFARHAGTTTVRAAFNGLTASTPVTVSASPAFTGAISAQATLVQASHIDELRLRTNLLRARYALSSVLWEDTSLVPTATIVRAQHIKDLRAALADVYDARQMARPNYTDPALDTGTTMKAVHIAELRAAVMAIE